MKIRVFNSIAEALTYFLLLLVIIFNIIIIVTNRIETQKAREANIQRQEDLNVLLKEVKNISKSNQAYIKCLSLLRFDNPTLGPTSTREQVESALDKCAGVE